MSSPIDDDIAAFVAHGTAQGWCEATVVNNRRRLATLARFLRRRGCRRMANVTPGDLDALLAGERDRGTARSSRVGLAVTVRSLFGWLQERGRLVSDPARTLPLPDDGEAALPEPPLSEAEVAALLASLPRTNAVQVRNACLIELLYGCGLRRGDAIGLTLRHVDLVERTVWVEDGKWGQSRLLPLMGTAATAVRDWLVMRRTLVRGPDRGHFFLTWDGKPMEAGSVAAVFRQLNARRGPEARHVHPHLLRHSIAVHLVRGGADVRHVQAFLGHASLDTTKIYLRMVPGRLKEDYDKAMPEIAVGLPR
jgi:site-specific recombinase XerD